MRVRHVLLPAVLALAAAALAACGDDDDGGPVIPDGGDFEPTEDVELEGTRNFDSVNIPAGVTATATDDLVLNVDGPVVIAGDLVGDCVSVGIEAEGDITVSGGIDNSCSGAPGADPPGLTLIGDGTLTLEGDDPIVSSGDVEMQNDPTLTDADFPAAARAPVNGLSPAGGTPTCIVAKAYVADPETAPDGADGSPDGQPGEDASNWRLSCRGELLVQLGFEIAGQNGGAGGDGEHTAPDDAEARGGDGGDGGRITVRATGDITFSGTGNTIRSGSGGAGGAATAVADGDDPGGDATATGGAGGVPGLFEIRAGGEIFITNPGAATVTIGDGGAGGAATATGGDGKDADDEEAAQPGGTATADGGPGGSTPDLQLVSAGAVTGAENVTLAGGNGGDGGTAAANGGVGGDGNQEFKDGADGGDMTANGGRGGDAQLSGLDGDGFGESGDGGDATIAAGTGGNGYTDCVAEPFDEGGDGGRGGDGAGSGGAAGAVALLRPPALAGLAGEAGEITISTAGNGGAGGDGAGPGDGGEGGADNTLAPATVIEPSFQPGPDGVGCGAPNLSGTYAETFTVPTGGDPNGHAPFVQFDTIEELTKAIDGTTIQITGGAPWPAGGVSGTFDPATGNFTAVGKGAIAGRSNVIVRVNGTLTAEGQEMEVIVGEASAPGVSTPIDPLPGGPITYNATGTKQ
jgi:hypothetical protein